MKKILSVIAISLLLNACNKVEDEQAANSAKTLRKDLVTNSFEYEASAGDNAMVTEFKTTTGKDCTVVQASYMSDYSKGTMSCKATKEQVFSTEKLGKVHAQYMLNILDNEAQVTELITKSGKDCTIIQAYYHGDRASSSMSCS